MNWNVYDTFPYKKFISDLPLSFNVEELPNPPQNVVKKQGHKIWYYGDSVAIKINLLYPNYDKDGNIIKHTEEDLKFLEKKNIIVTLYNFHFEDVISEKFKFDDINIENACIYFIIDEEISRTFFQKGIYYLGVRIENRDYFDDDVTIESNLLVRNQYFIPNSSEKVELNDEILNYFTHNIIIQGNTIMLPNETIVSPENFLIDVR